MLQMTDTFNFNKKREYGCERHSKVQLNTSESECYATDPKAPTDTCIQKNNNTIETLIEVPWDDDNFSLCLDTFPASRFANTRYNKYPTIASPLRRHWGSSFVEQVDSGDDDEEEIIVQDVPLPGVEEEKDQDWIHNSSGNVSQATITKPKDTYVDIKKTKYKAKRRTSQALNVVIGASFPYNNNTNFISGHAEEKKTPSSIITYQSQRSRVEHISPLNNSSIILNPDDILNQPLSPQSPRSMASVLPRKRSGASSIQSGISLATNQHHNDNQVSNMTTRENWKVAQGSPMERSISDVSTRFPHLQQQQQQPYLPLSHQTNYYQDGNMTSSSGSVTPSRSIVPTLNRNHSFVSNVHSHHNCLIQNFSCSCSASSYFHTPTASMLEKKPSDTRSFQSVPVTRNADRLVFYSNDPSLYPRSEVSEEITSFSEIFKPDYHQKKRRSGRKNSVGLFTKLMKNLKHHFIKTQ